MSHRIKCTLRSIHQKPRKLLLNKYESKINKSYIVDHPINNSLSLLTDKNVKLLAPTQLRLARSYTIRRLMGQ